MSKCWGRPGELVGYCEGTMTWSPCVFDPVEIVAYFDWWCSDFSSTSKLSDFSSTWSQKGDILYIYICIYITTALRYQLKYMIKLAYLASSFLTPSVFVCLGWSCDRWHQSFINWNQKPIKHPSLLPNMALLIINSFWRRTGSIFRSHLL